MKHINITSFKGSITDWIKLNYLKGGLADEYADMANVNGNYVKNSNNLLIIPDVPETTLYGITYKAKNGIVTLNGKNTDHAIVKIDFEINKVDLEYQAVYRFKDFYTTPSYSGKANYRLIGNGTFTDVYIGNGNRTTIENYPERYINIYEIVTKKALVTFDNVVLKPMLLYGEAEPMEYKPGSTTGLYIEDNVNDELIPINEGVEEV